MLGLPLFSRMEQSLMPDLGVYANKQNEVSKFMYRLVPKVWGLGTWGCHNGDRGRSPRSSLWYPKGSIPKMVKTPDCGH